MYGPTRCGFCGHQTTKVVEILPAGAVFKQVAITCQACDAILSTTDFFDTNEQISAVRAEMEALQAKMDSLEKGLRDIDQLLRQFAQKARQ